MTACCPSDGRKWYADSAARDQIGSEALQRRVSQVLLDLALRLRHTMPSSRAEAAAVSN
jgi:hypothetical protein